MSIITRHDWIQLCNDLSRTHMAWRSQVIPIPGHPDRVMWCPLWDQSGAVITWPNISWYGIRYCNHCLMVQNYKYTPHIWPSRANDGRVHCVDLGENWSSYNGTAMYFVDNSTSWICQVVHNKSINFVWHHCMNLMIYRTLVTSSMIYEWNWIYMAPSNGYYIMRKGPNIHHEIVYYVCLKLWRASKAF